MINPKLKEYLADNIKDFQEKVNNKENVMIIPKGSLKIGMSSAAIPISKYINQVFDEELAKLTNKKIKEVCRKQNVIK